MPPASTPRRERLEFAPGEHERPIEAGRTHWTRARWALRRPTRRNSHVVSTRRLRSRVSANCAHLRRIVAVRAAVRRQFVPMQSDRATSLRRTRPSLPFQAALARPRARPWPIRLALWRTTAGDRDLLRRRANQVGLATDERLPVRRKANPLGIRERSVYSRDRWRRPTPAARSSPTSRGGA